MTYGYVRISTDRQDYDNQKFEIENFCKRQNIEIDEWIEEIVSGTKDPKKRKLGKLLEIAKADDLIICGEISRLGRSMFMIMDILKGLLEKEVKVWTIKDNYRLDNSMQSKVLAFAFGLAAEVERDMISKRTKEALARKRELGIHLGRPMGAKNLKTKLYDKRETITDMVTRGHSISEIARQIECSRDTLRKEIKIIGIDHTSYQKIPMIYALRGSVLDNKADTVKILIDRGKAISDIAMIMKVHWVTVDKFLKKRGWATNRDAIGLSELQYRKYVRSVTKKSLNLSCCLN